MIHTVILNQDVNTDEIKYIDKNIYWEKINDFLSSLKIF